MSEPVSIFNSSKGVDYDERTNPFGVVLHIGIPLQVRGSGEEGRQVGLAKKLDNEGYGVQPSDDHLYQSLASLMALVD
jgi:hypothetical protein